MVAKGDQIMKQLSNEYIGDELSHGTMREEDLIPYFMDFLQNVKEKCEITTIVDQIQKEVDSLEMIEHEGYSGPDYKDQETASYILNEDIWDLLNDIAPEFTYFGSSEGDGASYGFWTSEDALHDHIQEEVGEIANHDYLDLEEVKNTLSDLAELLENHNR
jgi:hypothetical protein